MSNSYISGTYNLSGESRECCEFCHADIAALILYRFNFWLIFISQHFASEISNRKAESLVTCTAMAMAAWRTKLKKYRPVAMCPIVGSSASSAMFFRSRTNQLDKVHPRTGGIDVYLYSFFNLGAMWGGGGFNATPWPLSPWERDPVPIV